MGRGHRIGLLTAAMVVATSIAMPPLAWARYGSARPETNIFATHVLVAPAQPTCSGLGVLSVTLNWVAPSDAALITSYDYGVSNTSGTGYAYTNVGLVTSKAIGTLALGNQYFVIRSRHNQWFSSNSPERTVFGAVVLTTCP